LAVLLIAIEAAVPAIFSAGLISTAASILGPRMGAILEQRSHGLDQERALSELTPLVLVLLASFSIVFVLFLLAPLEAILFVHEVPSSPENFIYLLIGIYVIKALALTAIATCFSLVDEILEWKTDASPQGGE
jgi:hypothetical protein